MFDSKHFAATPVWVEFADFTWWRMEIKTIRFVGGFARAGAIDADDYHAAEPDPISAFAAPVMAHMNGDHSDASLAMVKHYIGFPATSARRLRRARVVCVAPVSSASRRRVVPRRSEVPKT